MRAAIFDLDGTLVDSEPEYFAVDREFFASWGFDYTEEICRASLGMGTMDFFRDMALRFPGSPLSRLPLGERAALRDAFVLEHAIPRIKAFPAMCAFVPGLAASGVLLAVASGSSPAVVGRILASTGLGRYFPTVVSASEVARGKPAPDVFLETARRLGVLPRDCLVLEDSVAGVEAAAAAGMPCIALPAPGSDPAAYPTAGVLFEGGPAAVGEAELWRAARRLFPDAVAAPPCR